MNFAFSFPLQLEAGEQTWVVENEGGQWHEFGFVKIDDAMTVDVRAFPPEAPLAEVAKVMTERKLGCAVVVERGRVIGIFTAMDALRLLAS